MNHFLPKWLKFDSVSFHLDFRVLFLVFTVLILPFLRPHSVLAQGEVLPFFGERKVLEGAETQEFPGNVSVKGGTVLIYDSGGTDYMAFRHDGTDANLDFDNTTDLNIPKNLSLTGYLDMSAGSEPSNVAGRMYYDSSGNVMKFYDGSSWNSMSGGTSLWTDAGAYINPTTATGFQIADTTGNTTIPGSLTVDTDTLYVDSSMDYVGIGTTAPGNKLTVYSNNTTTTDGLQIEQDSTGDAILNFELTGTEGYAMGIDNSDNDSFKLVDDGGAGMGAGDVVFDFDPSTNYTSLMAGNVGIGTTAPSALFDVAGNMDIDGNIQKPASSLYIDAAGAGAGVFLQTGGTDKFTVLSDGKLWTTEQGCGNIVPEGMIGMFDSACPTGWTEVADLQNKFPRGSDGDATYCETGGNLCKKWMCYGPWFVCNRCGSANVCTESGYCGPTHATFACTTTTIEGAWRNLSSPCFGCHEFEGCTRMEAAAGACRTWKCGPTIHTKVEDGPDYREVVFCKKD